MLKIICVLLFFPLAAMAQPPPSPPSDAELLQGRAQAAESRADYLGLLIRRLQAEEAKTAAWWSAYIGLKDDPPK